MPIYENIWHAFVKGLLEYTNHNADFMLDKLYLDRTYFRRERIYTSLEKIDSFEL